MATFVTAINLSENRISLMSGNRTFFPALTGLRAVAAIMVFLHHYFANHPQLPVFLNMLVTKMYIGLTLFFVLTGFLIAFRYFPSAQLSASFLKRYYQNRFVRVYPLYFILTVIILVAQQNQTWQVWLLNLTLTKALFNEYKFTGLPQAWSLTVIELFYLFAPLLQLWVRKNRSPWWWLLPAYATGVGLVLLSNWLHLGSFFEHLKFMLVFTVFGHAFSFLFGMWCMGVLEKAKTFAATHQGWLTNGSFMLLVAIMYAWSYLAWQHTFFKPHEPGGILLANVLLAVFCGGLILGLITEETWLSRLLSWKPVVEMGKSSYAFYLLNMGFFATLAHDHLSSNPFVIFALAAVAAYFAHRYFEVPLMKCFGGSRFLKPAEGSKHGTETN